MKAKLRQQGALRTGPDDIPDLKQSKRQQRRAKADEEARIRAAEAKRLKDPLPTSEADFQKLVKT